MTEGKKNFLKWLKTARFSFLKMGMLAVLTASFSMIYGQDSTDEKEKLGLVGLHIGFGLSQPGGDLADRFGWSNHACVGLDFLTKNDWIFGAELPYFFGTRLNEDPLANLRESHGSLIGNNLELAEVQLRERGFFIGGYFGKIISFKNTKERAHGLRLTFGGGWFQHKIRIQDDNSTAPQVAGAYKKGYDRLTGGPGLSQFVGWQILSRSKRVNFFAGLDFYEGFTKSLRDFDFRLQKKDDSARFDLRLGAKIGWTMPFYVGEKGEDIYY